MRRAEQDARAEDASDDADEKEEREEAARVWSEGVAVGDGAGDGAGKSAAVLVALAAIGAMPVKSNAGKEMKLPPPATALSRPAISAAKNRRSECEKGTRENSIGGKAVTSDEWRVASDW